MNIPIGILTRNRAVYLDTTLKSLQNSNAPEVIIFDDCSDDPDTRRLLDTSDEFQIEYEWPKYQEWKDAGLDFLKDNPTVNGIHGKIKVHQVCVKPVGVVNASCWTIRDLFRMNPQAPAVILLQDDVVFQKDWYEILTNHPRDKVAIIAGMHLDYAGTRNYYTAQCYLITREFYENKNWWFIINHKNPFSFDVKICRKALNEGFAINCILPYICQHIGVVSQVRPHRKFKTDNYMRIGSNNSIKQF